MASGQFCAIADLLGRYRGGGWAREEHTLTRVAFSRLRWVGSGLAGLWLVCGFWLPGIGVRTVFALGQKLRKAGIWCKASCLESVFAHPIAYKLHTKPCANTDSRHLLRALWAFHFIFFQKGCEHGANTDSRHPARLDRN